MMLEKVEAVSPMKHVVGALVVLSGERVLLVRQGESASNKYSMLEGECSAVETVRDTILRLLTGVSDVQLLLRSYQRLFEEGLSPEDNTSRYWSMLCNARMIGGSDHDCQSVVEARSARELSDLIVLLSGPQQERIRRTVHTAVQVRLLSHAHWGGILNLG